MLENISKFRFLTLYVFVAILELLIDSFLLPTESLRFFTKPALMLLLIFFVIDNLQKNERSKLIYALFFAWLGDVFLLFSAPFFFPLGLLSFLVMQIIYIRMFCEELFGFSKNLLLNLIMLILILVYVLFLLKILWPGVSTELSIPVVVYALALGSMAYFAFLRKAVASNLNFKLVFVGAILFVISDSLLAINKFYQSFSGNSFWVMGTYILAQLLLSVGLVNFAICKRLDIHESGKYN